MDPILDWMLNHLYQGLSGRQNAMKVVEYNAKTFVLHLLPLLAIVAMMFFVELLVMRLS